MVKVIGVNPNGYLVVIRLENGTIMRVREDSFEIDHIPDRPGKRKHIDYEDLLLTNDFIVEIHRSLQKFVGASFMEYISMYSNIGDGVKALIKKIYEPPMAPCLPPSKTEKETVHVWVGEGKP